MSKFAVPFPQAGEGVELRMTPDGLQRLEDAYGPDYFRLVLNGLAGARVSVIRKCLEVAAPDVDIEKVFEHPLDETADVIGDAMMMIVKGKTVAELEAAE